MSFMLNSVHSWNPHHLEEYTILVFSSGLHHLLDMQLDADLGGPAETVVHGVAGSTVYSLDNDEHSDPLHHTSSIHLLFYHSLVYIFVNRIKYAACINVYCSI